ncbi:MAG: hypothetical protein ABIO25_01255 [Specibacter sp.]
MAGEVAGLDAQALAPIPGGSIELRDDRSGPARTVELLPFALGRTQVTRADGIAWCNRASALAGLTPAYSVDGR